MSKGKAAITGIRRVRLLVPSNKAKPSPAIGQALGSLGVNMMQFCKRFNEASAALKFKDDIPLRVKMTVMPGSPPEFSFLTLLPPTSWMLKKCAGIEKGAHNSGTEVVGTIHVKQVYEIAKLKNAEMDNGQDLQGLCRMICASANTCGIKVVATKEGEL